MKNDRAEWEIQLDIKATCGDRHDPPGRLRYRLSGAWDPDKVSAGEILARDLAEVLRVASRVLVPGTRTDIVQAFADELSNGIDVVLND